MKSQASHRVVVHYHEIGLKGRNRGAFERKLVGNLERRLGPRGSVESLTGRLVVRTDGEPRADVLDEVGATFGVAAYAPALVVRAEIEEMIGAANELLDGASFESFAIAARRATKQTPMTSREINIALGSAVESAFSARVDLSHPDVTVHVEVVGSDAFVYTDRRVGPGGLPVGVSGKVVSLLSGGIDSPVATYRILRRGAKAVLCHFHSAPFTDASSERKAGELAELVRWWQGDTLLYLVPLGDAQQRIVVEAPPDLRVILYRRLMVRIAERVAAQENAKALVTGDSLGQVASQTMENMACVDDVATLPVFRPLVGDDKQAIVDEAKAIGTYETSIQPFEDCCSLFVPRSPATRASIEACRRAEAGLPIDELAASCLSAGEVKRFRAPAEVSV